MRLKCQIYLATLGQKDKKRMESQNKSQEEESRESYRVEVDKIIAAFEPG